MMILFFGAIAHGEEPQIPDVCEDKVLYGNETRQKFFDSRALDLECRSKLDLARLEYDKSNSHLNDAMAKPADRDTISHLEKEMLRQKKNLIAFLFQCGSCATHPVERRDIDDQIWYVSDGSCSVHGSTSTQMYKRAQSFLRGIRNYPQYLGGLTNVLEFVVVDPKNGKALWETNYPTASPVDIFISVRGPKVLGFLTAVSYFSRGTFGESSDGKEFSIQFNSKRPTMGFRAPRVYYLPAAGRVPGQLETERIEAQQVSLHTIRGSWCLNSDGNLRYFTAADFGELFQGSTALAGLMGTDLALSILRETLFDLSEVARGVH